MSGMQLKSLRPTTTVFKLFFFIVYPTHVAYYLSHEIATSDPENLNYTPPQK